MANDMFTSRSGKQLPIPEITIPKSVMTSVMRLQEEYLLRGQRLSLSGVILELLSVGKDTIERRWSQAAKNKELRNAGKSVREYIRTQLILGKPLDSNAIAKLSGMEVPTDNDTIEGDGSLDVLDGDAELTDEQLDAATSPNGVA